jgi:hypothetical protein
MSNPSASNFVLLDPSNGGPATAVDNARSLFLWTPWKGNVFKKVDLGSPTLSIAISPDGDRIAVTTDRGIRIYSIN